MNPCVFSLASGILLLGVVERPDHGVAALVAQLGDPDFQVREKATRQLAADPAAGPWVRKATRHADPEIAKRARAVLAEYARQRQAAVPKVLPALTKAGQVDLFLEWYFFWRPANKDDLWQPGLDFGWAAVAAQHKLLPAGVKSKLGQKMPKAETLREPREPPTYVHDGPSSEYKPTGALRRLLIRTDELDAAHPGVSDFTLAAARGPAMVRSLWWNQLFSLDSVTVLNHPIAFSVIVCDGDIKFPPRDPDKAGPPGIGNSLLVCRGSVASPVFVSNSVILAGGDVHLEDCAGFPPLKGEGGADTLVRAGGAVHPSKFGQRAVANCRIESGVKDPTAPFKFFELADVGLTPAKPENPAVTGLPVEAVRPDTPLARAGVAKGDVIVAIDGEPVTAGPERFRRQLRKVVVTQGDCLLTVSRAGKAVELPVYFPLPK